MTKNTDSYSDDVSPVIAIVVFNCRDINDHEINLRMQVTLTSTLLGKSQ